MASGEGTESSGIPAWVWWLLAAVAIALAVAVPLILRNRRRAVWQADFATAKEDVVWFARSLVPQLRQSGTLDQLSGGWRIGSPRVAGTEDRLTVLESSAPRDEDGAAARALRDAVRASRDQMRALLANGDSSAISPDLDEIAARLEAALAPPPPVE